MIESTGLQMWLNSGNSNEIKVKGCPRCTVPITFTRRFKDEIFMWIENITKVKVKFIGNNFFGEHKRNNSLDKLNEISVQFKSKHLLYSSIHEIFSLITCQYSCLTSAPFYYNLLT